MSLIPSESYSFPDHFTSTVTPSRKPKQKPEEAKVVRKPAIVALPDPEPETEAFVTAEPVAEAEAVAEMWEPEPVIAAEPIPEPEIWEPEMPQIKAPPPAAPNPVLRRIQALLPRVLAKPVVESEIAPELWEPEVPEVKPPPPMPKPNPALRRAQAPPPKVQEAPIRKIALPPTLKPKVRWNNRTAPLDPNRIGANGNGNGSYQQAPAPAPAQNVIPMKAAKPAPPPQPIPPPRPVQQAPRSIQSVPRPVQPAPVLQKSVQAPPPRPVQRAPVLQKPVQPPPPRKPAAIEARPVQPRRASPKPASPLPLAAQADLFEMSSDNGYELAAQRRKQMKFRRFVTCEAATLLVLVPLVILGLALNISAPTIRWIMNILTIAAAVSAVLIPIVFYAATPTLPEIDR